MNSFHHLRGPGLAGKLQAIAKADSKLLLEQMRVDRFGDAHVSSGLHDALLIGYLCLRSRSDYRHIAQVRTEAYPLHQVQSILPAQLHVQQNGLNSMLPRRSESLLQAFGRDY